MVLWFVQVSSRQVHAVLLMNPFPDLLNWWKAASAHNFLGPAPPGMVEIVKKQDTGLWSTSQSQDTAMEVDSEDSEVEW